MTGQAAGLAWPRLVQVDLGWWKVAGCDLVQVISPRTAVGTAWIVWRGDHVLHITDTLPNASGWVVDQVNGGGLR